MKFAMLTLSRRQWIDACRFHELTQQEVLHEVAERVTRLRVSSGHEGRKHPLVLFDLDSTLYEVGPRTFEILREWHASAESAEHDQVRDAVERLLPVQVGYSIGDTLSAAGLSLDDERVRAAIAAIKSFWGKRFFTSFYLAHDRPYPGAAEFASRVYRLGAEIVYLTGRDEPGMGEGTRANLIRDGFPWNVERTHLLMKASPELPDLGHKVGAADYVRRHGALVASFENEPPNVVALQGVFPDAMHVFVDTVCSEHGAEPRAGLYRIRGFN